MRQADGQLEGQGGLKLHYRHWEPDEVRGNIVLVHGMGEHIGRYGHVAAWFAARSFAVWAMDHRGHGQSEGLRLHVDQFEEYLTDLNALVRLTTERHGKPVMIGHSMGGLISYRYAIAYPQSIAGLILSSPWFSTKTKVSPVQRLFAPLLSTLLPRLQLPTPVNPEVCNRNPEMWARDRKDPLICRSTTPRWFIECTRAQAACLTSLTFPVGLPALFLVAGTDLLADPEASRAIYARVGHDRKAFKLYPEKYHEIFNDPGWEEVLGDALAWLQAQGLAPAAESTVTSPSPAPWP